MCAKVEHYVPICKLLLVRTGGEHIEGGRAVPTVDGFIFLLGYVQELCSVERGHTLPRFGAF